MSEIQAMDAKDELLAKLDAIDAQRNAEKNAAKQQTEAKLKGQSPPTQSSSKPPTISTEDFLAKLDALDRATRPVPAPPKPTPSKPAPPKPQAKTPSTQQRSPRPSGRSQPSPSNPPVPLLNPPSPSPSPRSSQPPQQPAISNVIERLKQFTQAQLAAHAAENKAKAKRAREIAHAQAWLDELDPLSDDGFWFEQFAESYDSRLEAALVFLDPGKASQTKRS